MPQYGVELPTAAAIVRTRVEPKTFFAAERTFLSWINIAVLLMFAALSLASTGGGGGNSIAGSGGGGGGAHPISLGDKDKGKKNGGGKDVDANGVVIVSPLRHSSQVSAAGAGGRFLLEFVSVFGAHVRDVILHWWPFWVWDGWMDGWCVYCWCVFSCGVLSHREIWVMEASGVWLKGRGRPGWVWMCSCVFPFPWQLCSLLGQILFAAASLVIPDICSLITGGGSG